MKVGFKGGGGLGVALRPLGFGVVVAELDEEDVAGHQRGAHSPRQLRRGDEQRGQSEQSRGLQRAVPGDR